MPFLRFVGHSVKYSHKVIGNAFESIGPDVYFTHPYSAWERGQNEHFNGMLCRFIPKGKDLSFLTQDDLDRFATCLNTLPRKSLG